MVAMNPEAIQVCQKIRQNCIICSLILEGILPLFRRRARVVLKGAPRIYTAMIPQQWTSPCGNGCTNKYAALMQIPWRVFCKKGCDTDGDTWEDCLSECNEICYKDPVLKEYQWSAYIDRSPGADDYSAECFNACITGCSYKFNVPTEIVETVHPKRPPKPVNVKNEVPLPKVDIPSTEDVPSTSA